MGKTSGLQLKTVTSVFVVTADKWLVVVQIKLVDLTLISVNLMKFFNF